MEVNKIPEIVKWGPATVFAIASLILFGTGHSIYGILTLAVAFLFALIATR